VNLTGVATGQTIKVMLGGVNDGTRMNNVEVSMSVLLGDVNWNGTVTSTDIAQTKALSGQAPNAINFRADVNASGSVTATDIAVVKSRAGTTLTPQSAELSAEK
jgi:hypothetical protein